MRKFSVISRNSVHFFKTHILVYEQPLGLGTAIVQSSLLPELQHIHWNQRMAETGNGLRPANPMDLNNYWSFLAFTTWKPSSFQTCNAQDSQSLLSPSTVINPSAFIWNCPSQTQSDLALKWVLIPDISQTIPDSVHSVGTFWDVQVLEHGNLFTEKSPFPPHFRPE